MWYYALLKVYKGAQKKEKRRRKRGCGGRNVHHSFLGRCDIYPTPI
jgi:hypothetical protein